MLIYFNSKAMAFYLYTAVKFLTFFLFACRASVPCPMYDYIVVGAGSAGATVASRLSEDENVSVLLLEAGGDPLPVISEVPFFSSKQLNTISDWKYVTERQENACLSLVDQIANYPAGRVIGGSSTINQMIYSRGNRKDFDKWAAMGCKGWSYNDILPYFLKSEGNSNAALVTSKFHNSSGPLGVSTPVYHTPLREAFLQSMQDKKYQLNDYNGKTQTGCSTIQTTIKGGFRCSTKNAFIDFAIRRQNFQLKTEAHVYKIDFDEQQRARGVRYYEMPLKKQKIACARREIIVSCGTIRSPQLLMLSGIGPKQHLHEMGIDNIVSDLPGVGQNLMDHVGPFLYSTIKYPISLQRWINFKPSNFKNDSSAKGPLSIPFSMEGIAFINTKYANASDDYPDIEIEYSSMVYFFTGTKPKILDAGMEQVNADHDGFMLYPSAIHPYSRGFVKLRTTNSFDQPIIDPRFLSDQRDVLTLMEGLRFCLDLVQNGTFQKYKPRLIPVPGCDAIIGSDEWLECTVRTFTMSSSHYAGTCKMGNVNDSMTVVDPQLRVKNVKGLRVVDASVMPQIPSGNTNAPTIMIGEKAADMIKEANKLR